MDDNFTIAYIINVKICILLKNVILCLLNVKC